MTASEREALVARVRAYLDVEFGDPNKMPQNLPVDREAHGESPTGADLRALCAEVERLTRERDAWRRLVRDDGYAMTFQSLGQYRNALLAAIDAARTTGGRDA